VVSGRITFDRLTFSSVQGGGLNSTPVVSPAREVVVEIVGATAGSTTTDVGGYYAFTALASSNVSILARAQMQRTGSAPIWNFRVLNNANSDALYVLQGSTFNTGTDNVTRNLHAPSGWGGSSYTGTRAAAPFAILDTVYNAKQMILGAESAAAFPALDLFWSDENRPSTSFCPDDGNIGTSFYFSGVGNDECSPASRLPEGIYILGEYAGGASDTDEFDAHVIAHEFGHYFEDKFSRSDSLGGEHASGDRLDLRVAFGEGWGNAFAAMSLGDPLYRDSFDGISDDFGFDLESDSTSNEGWFSEASIGEFLWDVFDADTTPESSDNVALDFAPIYAVMTDQQVGTDAFTSIFSFAAALRSDNPNSSSAIRDVLQREEISGTDAFGANESNNGGDPRALPVYADIVLNTPKNNVCSSSVAGNTDGNKLGNRRFLRFQNNQARTVTISANGGGTDLGTVAATDPDILVVRNGEIVLAGESTASGQEVISQAQLAAGTYILDVYDFDVRDTGTSAPRCMTVSVTGS
jgi:hypothetical protein